MIALIAVVMLCIHLGLGWWTTAAILAYVPVLSAGIKS